MRCMIANEIAASIKEGAPHQRATTFLRVWISLILSREGSGEAIPVVAGSEAHQRGDLAVLKHDIRRSDRVSRGGGMAEDNGPCCDNNLADIKHRKSPSWLPT